MLQLRGLIFLSLQREQEAYTDFSQVLAIQVAHSSSLKNPTNDSRLPEHMKEQVFQNHHLLTSFDGRLIYKLLQSAIPQNEDSLTRKIGDMEFDLFAKGLAEGLLEGGQDTLKELGPFLTHLVFHPINTAEELLNALHFLLTKALEKDWETIGEVLVPELKELFYQWDTLEDIQKGKLVGLFVGKNGMAALTALGVCKTFAKLKKVVVGCDTTKLLRVLKRTEPKFTPLPASDISFLLVPKNKAWRLRYTDGNLIEKSFVGECSLVQMAPNGLKNKALFEGRAIHQLQAMGDSPLSWEMFENSVLIEQSPSLPIDFRKVLPPVIEVETVSTNATAGKLAIGFNEIGEVTLSQVSKSEKIFVRNLNTKTHIMQPKHGWDKLIKLTGDREEDCKKVIKLLEDNQIYLEKYRLDPINGYNHQNFIRYNHQMKIDGYEVKAFFNKSLETGELFLNNGWVITK